MTGSVYERIRAAIIAGEFDPKKRLAESALAERFGTSRTPVREAMQRLESERLIERTHRGTFIRRVEPEEILDIYDVLKVLEAAAARMAAERATEMDLMRLRGAHRAMVEFTEPDATHRAALNRAFHEKLWEAGHSATTANVLRQLNSHLVVTARTTLAVEDRWKAVLREHAEILAAVEAHDSDAAATITEQHMVDAREVRVSFYVDPEAAGAH